MDNKVRRVCESALTVRQAVKELLCFDQDAPLFFVCDYGDYHHTQQALPVSEIYSAETGHLAPSAYSHSGVCLLEEDKQEGDNDDEYSEIAILS